MLGENALGDKTAGFIELALSDYAFALLEQVRGNVMVDDRDSMLAVGDLEQQGAIGSVRFASLFDKAAHANILIEIANALLNDVGRRLEERYRVLQSHHGQRYGAGRQQSCRSDQP